MDDLQSFIVKSWYIVVDYVEQVNSFIKTLDVWEFRGLVKTVILVCVLVVLAWEKWKDWKDKR